MKAVSSTLKGVYPFEDIARIASTNLIAKMLELHVPSLDAKRHLVVLEAA